MTARLNYNKAIKRILHYDSAYELLFNEVFLDEYMTGDEIEELEHVDDYEGFAYLVITDAASNRSVIVSEALSGDIIGVDTLGDFLTQTVKYIREGAQA